MAAASGDSSEGRGDGGGGVKKDPTVVEEVDWSGASYSGSKLEYAGVNVRSKVGRCKAVGRLKAPTPRFCKRLKALLYEEPLPNPHRFQALVSTRSLHPYT